MLRIPTSHAVALLIDADNIQLSCLEQILKLADYYGDVHIRRAYGDWKQPPLSASAAKVQKLDVKVVQVKRSGKDTTDKQLLIEAGEILGSGDADIFIIASGDGDFALLCERIKEKGRKVVGIGNKKQASPHLQKSCETFYYIEELDELLIQLQQTRLQEEFKALVFRALDLVPHDPEGWVNCGQLGKKLRELDPDFNERFGSRKLSEWLTDLSGQLDRNGQLIRRVIDPESLQRVSLLRAACLQVKRADGLAHIGQIGQILRKLDSGFESHFGGKKLSEWFKQYPDIFTQHENYISLSVE